jgi:cell division transport system permease protein
VEGSPNKGLDEPTAVPIAATEATLETHPAVERISGQRMINLAYTLKEAFRGLRETKRMAFLSATTMSLSLLIFGIFLLATININHVVRRLQEKVEVEIFLQDSISPEEREKLTVMVRNLDEVLEVVYVSKEAALQEAHIDTTFINTVGTNPLPASLQVHLKEGYRSAADIEDVIRHLENEAGIEEISSGSRWAHQLDRYILLLSLATAVIGVLFGLTSSLIISNTIQLTIFSRRETITIMQLVGAANGLIRGPFVLEGILQGTVAGGIAAIGLAGFSWSIRYHLPWFLPIGPVPQISIILAGGLLGGLGSSYAVEKSLTTDHLF